MVRLVVVFSATSEREAQELLDGLRFLEPLTRLQTGCLACSNWREADLTLMVGGALPSCRLQL